MASRAPLVFGTDGLPQQLQPGDILAGLVNSTVRQTALAGPLALLPATSASLALATQNVSATSPLLLTAAQGFGLTGASDAIFATASNLTWASLTASSTLYLFVNAATGAMSFSTLQPIYQFGGTISTTAGQFTFDYQAMIGNLGNGSAAVATPLVCVGECVTSASGVTSTIAYAYNGLYEGPFVNTLPAGGTATAFSHNLGIVPETADLFLKCVTADAGYSVGDFMLARSLVAASYPMISLSPARNTLTWTSVAGQNFNAVNKTSGAGTTLTFANWAYRLKAARGWGGA